jgi:RsiW-degrading membrane proteinase PrsW (M82 family)
MASPFYLFYLFLSLIPSFLWLIYFLHQDEHPESKKQIAKIFGLGALATLPALLIETSFSNFLAYLNFPGFLTSFLTIFLGVAFVEEVLKYLVVKWQAVPSKEMDEPIDAMIYMITSAMGFATIENALLFFRANFSADPLDPWIFLLMRFLGATFLHALASGILGFFLALVLFQKRNHFWLIFGLIIATSLHGLFNFVIIEIESVSKVYLLLMILTSLAFFVSWGLKRLKDLEGYQIIK